MSEILLLFLFVLLNVAFTLGIPCNEHWPSLSLILPLNLGKNARLHEWENIFFKSFLFFWPYDKSDTSIIFIVDEEVKTSEYKDNYEAFASRIDFFRTNYPSIGFVIKSNDFPKKYWNDNGHSRQQLIMFYADEYVSSDYIGFVDTDALFISYVSVDDIFKFNKPLILGRVGIPQSDFWKEVSSTTAWIMNGKLEPMRCMSFFPFVIQTKHIREMRNYFEKIHNQTFLDVFQKYSEKSPFSQFNAMCSYLWYEKKEHYYWNVRMTDKNWNESAKHVPGMETNMDIYDPWMLVPWPRIAVHTRYHATNDMNAVIVEGYCRSPPYDKHVHFDHVNCSHYKEDYIFKDMHSFEYTNFLRSEDESVALEYQYERQQRLRECNHTYDLSLYPYIN